MALQTIAALSTDDDQKNLVDFGEQINQVLILSLV
jgi:hypothetical protein